MPVKIQWSSDMDSLLGTMSDYKLAIQLGLSKVTVRNRRCKLGITLYSYWTSETEALLGTMPDKELAKQLGITSYRIWWRRKKLGIPSWRSQQPLLKGIRRRRIQKLPNTLTCEQWNFAVNFFEGHCAYCRECVKMFLVMDHLIPVAKGGPKTALNIVPACLRCNNSKHAKRADLWIYEHFRMEEGQEVINRIVTYLTSVKEKVE